MGTVATTLRDVQDQLRYQLSELPHVVAAYLTVDMSPAKIHVWTLLDARDEQSEEALAKAELGLLTSFRMVQFDFTTVHLQNRDPREFIPEGAHAVLSRRADVDGVFQDAIRP
jgi:hypothetical protein